MVKNLLYPMEAEKMVNPVADSLARNGLFSPYWQVVDTLNVLFCNKHLGKGQIPRNFNALRHIIKYGRIKFSPDPERFDRWAGNSC